MGKNSSENILRTLRREHNLKQVEVAAAVGISRSFLAGIEAGHELPGRETLMALADFYNVSLDMLAQRIGSPAKGAAQATNEKEALLLSLFRGLKEKEADSLINMLLARFDTEKN
jgi:transcriptional regulator with XRE-family HTH domain